MAKKGFYEESLGWLLPPLNPRMVHREGADY